MPTFFDLQKELTTNKEFGAIAQKLMQVIVKAEQAGDKESLRSAIVELLRHCHWNPSLLVPYYFPAYPKDKPMTLWSRPHAFAMMATGSNNTLTIQASRQVGKCLTFSVNVLQRNLKGEVSEVSIKKFFDDAKKC